MNLHLEEWHYWVMLAIVAGLCLGLAISNWVQRTHRRQLNEQLTAQANDYAQLDKRYQQSVQNEQTVKYSLAQSRANEQAQQDKLKWLEHSQAQLKKEFETFSLKALEQESQRAKKVHEEGLQQLLQPLREQVREFRGRLDAVHKVDLEQQSGLRGEIQQLHKLHGQMHQDALNLTRALKGDSARQGAWGEMVLAKLLEASGLREGIEYVTQPSFTEGQHRKRPDVIVHFPDNKDIIIDSKVSLVAYESWVNSEDPEEQQQFNKQHLASIRQHIKDLSSKGYPHIEALNSIEATLLFVPIEGALAAALHADPQLFEQAYKKHIILTSPSTLLLALKTVYFIWRNEHQNNNAKRIAEQAGKICDQVVLINQAFEEIGQRLNQAKEAWVSSSKRLQSGRGNLLRQAHQLQELGAMANKTLPAEAEENL